MKRLISFAIYASIAMIAAQPMIRPQDSTQKKQPEAQGLEGAWTEICCEHAGKLVMSPPEVWRDPKPDSPKDRNSLWIISKEKIEKGPDGKGFPNERWRCKMDPGGKSGTIDGVLLGKEGKERPEHQWKAIFEIKGDYLLFCLNIDEPPVRPEKFTTSPRASGTFLFLLRRSKPKK